MQYKASSLLDIAEMFETRAGEELKKAHAAVRKKEKEWNRGAAAAYSDVGQTLRAMKLEPLEMFEWLCDRIVAGYEVFPMEEMRKAESPEHARKLFDAWLWAQTFGAKARS